MKQTCGEKEAGHKRVHTVWSHLYEVLEQKKLIKGKKNINTVAASQDGGGKDSGEMEMTDVRVI